MRFPVIIVAIALLGGCQTRVIYRDRPVEVKVPVSVPCATVRPAKVVALKEKTPDWESNDVRQKAAHVSKQGLERQTYGEQLDAATAACP